jgi:hypothetical protein
MFGVVLREQASTAVRSFLQRARVGGGSEQNIKKAKNKRWRKSDAKPC